MIIIEKYDNLHQYVDMFCKRKTNLLILEGEGGIGKSEVVNEHNSRRNYPVLGSHLTPLANYEALYEHRDKPIIFRDIDQLLTSPINVSLLKQVTETRNPKVVSYHTTKKLETLIPSSFETESTALIETNRFSQRNQNVSALTTRGQHVVFSPTQSELLKKMQEIVGKNRGRLLTRQKEEVYCYIKEMVGSISINLNLRHLVNGFNLYEYSRINPSFHWKEELKKNVLGDERMQIIEELSSLPLGEKERSCVWEDRTGLSRATYFRLKKTLKP